MCITCNQCSYNQECHDKECFLHDLPYSTHTAVLKLLKVIDGLKDDIKQLNGKVLELEYDINILEGKEKE